MERASEEGAGGLGGRRVVSGVETHWREDCEDVLDVVNELA
jgi:hypothetical protein